MAELRDRVVDPKILAVTKKLEDELKAYEAAVNGPGEDVEIDIDIAEDDDDEEEGGMKKLMQNWCS